MAAQPRNASSAAATAASSCSLDGSPTEATVSSVAGFSTFRQVRWAGAFEGYTTLALGVRARLPFRTFTLYDASTNRSRLVVDVAHRW